MTFLSYCANLTLSFTRKKKNYLCLAVSNKMTCLPKMKHEDTIRNKLHTEPKLLQNILQDRSKMRLCNELSSPCKLCCMQLCWCCVHYIQKRFSWTGQMVCRTPHLMYNVSSAPQFSRMLSTRNFGCMPCYSVRSVTLRHGRGT